MNATIRLKHAGILFLQVGAVNGFVGRVSSPRFATWNGLDGGLGLSPYSH